MLCGQPPGRGRFWGVMVVEAVTPVAGRRHRPPQRRRARGLSSWAPREGSLTATILIMVALVAGVGCGRAPRRIPYIPPDLANWSDTYRGPEGLRLHVFETTGSLAPPGGLLGGSWLEPATLEVPAFLIEHPRAGLIVVGTGLAPALGVSPEKHLGWFLASVAKATAKEGQDLVSQMKRAGFAPEKVRRLILPDCRFPQTGQITGFSQAEVSATEAERVWALRAGASSAVRRDDVLAVRRWETIDFGDAKPVGTFSRAKDLLGDGSVLLIDAPGYTPGTMAVLVRLVRGPVILAGGVAPLARTLRTPVVPAVAADADRWWDSAWRLKRLRELAVGLVVVPGFEKSALDADGRSDVRVHRTERVRETEPHPSRGGQRREQPSFPVQDPPTSPPPLGR